MQQRSGVEAESCMQPLKHSFLPTSAAAGRMLACAPHALRLQTLSLNCAACREASGRAAFDWMASFRSIQHLHAALLPWCHAHVLIGGTAASK
jgi:hypothetical protein